MNWPRSLVSKLKLYVIGVSSRFLRQMWQDATASTKRPVKGSQPRLKKFAPDSLPDGEHGAILMSISWGYAFFLADPILFFTTGLAVSSTTQVPPAFSMASLADLLKR